MTEWLQALYQACPVIIVIGGALTYIVKGIKTAQKPKEEIEAKIDTVEKEADIKIKSLDEKYEKKLKEFHDEYHTEHHELGDRIKSCEKRLESDNDSIEWTVTAVGIMLKNTVTLLDHGLNGNNVAEMQKAKDETMQFLTKGKEVKSND